jgi:hypothetical protein
VEFERPQVRFALSPGAQAGDFAPVAVFGRAQILGAVVGGQIREGAARAVPALFGEFSSHLGVEFRFEAEGFGAVCRAAFLFVGKAVRAGVADAAIPLRHRAGLAATGGALLPA